MTASLEAASFYRQAQRAPDTAETVSALRHAVGADPAFQLAGADLGALVDAPAAAVSGRQMNWERHHVEVVRTAAAGLLARATDLLREHLANVGCDPVALRVVAELRQRQGQLDLDDLSGRFSACHPVSVTPSWGRRTKGA
ncbi:MAG TPA: hypothetical protein VGP46_04385 [Acidimicrobiales bacterium]|nr:hypothetical protein [Acidimicrobiales bacterium]